MDQDEQVFDRVLNHVNLDGDFTILELGTASGNTLCAILNMLVSQNKIPKQVIAFDSWEGLPVEDPDTPRQSDWHPSAFNLLYENQNNKKLSKKATTPEEAFQLLLDRFAEYESYGINIQLVKGFYEKTLNEGTLEIYKIKPATFVNIDCDLYISAKQALEFLFKNDLLAEDCIVRYDDWDMIGLREGEAGESKAHNEMVQKYRVSFELIEKGRDALFKYKGKK